jgi:hypothetical protein
MFGNVAKSVTVNLDATAGAQIGINLLLPDGTAGTIAQLQKLFGSTSSTATIGTTDDLDEGQFNLWFTNRRAQDAVGSILADTDTIDFTYAGGTSITATLKDLADSGAGAALVKITRDAQGRIIGTSAATTSDLTEGSNLYYTDARADARITLQKGAANGLAPLGSDAKISTSYLPAAVLGQVSYQGTWDASTGSPPTTTPSKGWYYVVTVAGSTSLSGITDWKVGDWAIYNGASWDKIDNTDAIASWNGRTGAVVPATGDYTFAQIGSKPTTLSGYGITDAATSAQGAKADTAVQSVVAGTNVTVDNTDPRNPVLSATGGGSLPPGYIDGLQLKWVSGTALTVSSGSAYIQSTGAVLAAASDIAKSGLSLSASTWYHVYLYSNAGTPDVEIVTTAPATAYSGTARSKTGDTSRRYVGSVLTNSTGSLWYFIHADRRVSYGWGGAGGLPQRVLSGGTATTATTISISGSVPVTATHATARLTNGDTSAGLRLANSAIPGASGSTGAGTNFLFAVSPGSNGVFDAPMDSSQAFLYWFTATPSGVASMDIFGYLFGR